MAAKRRKPNPQLLSAAALHQRWLQQHGVSKPQLRQRRTDRAAEFTPDTADEVRRTVAEDYYAGLSNGFAPLQGKADIWETLRRAGEAPAVVAEVAAKASRCLPAYNKGGLQYLGDTKLQLRNAGKKTVE